MKVKNIFLKLTAIAFLGAFSLKAEIPVTQIRGLASILNTECEFLSPVYGTLLDKSLYPKNLSNFGPRSTKTVKFARKIFHVVDNNLRNSVAPGNITTYLTPEAIGKIVAHIKNYTDNPSYDLKKSIADVLEQLSTTPNISARSIKSSKKHFNRDLVESLSENEVYIQNNTIYLLLTLLWKKVGNKTDFYEYFWGLYNTLINKNLFNEEIHQLLPDNVEKDQFIEILKSNINQNYTSDDAQNIKEEIMAYPQRLSFNKLAFFILEASLDQHKILPDLLSYGITTYKGKTFADCGSTTIRNFFNAIIWNTEEQNFNVNILRSLDANENLINFYTEYPNESTMCTREAHDAWANVVSGIRGVTYNETTAKCNIRNGIRNIFKIISHLLNSKLTSFEDFAELLEQKTGIKLKVASYSDEDWGKEDNVQQGYTGSENLVKIQITKVSSSPFEIAWRFTSGHSNIIFPTTTISERYAYLSNILSENFRSQSLYQNTKNIILLNQNVRQYFLSQIRPIEERTILEFFEILSRNLENPDTNLEIIKEIVPKYLMHLSNDDIWNQIKVEFIRNLYTTLLKDDEDPQKEFFETVIKSDLPIFNPNAEAFKQMTETQKYSVIKTCLEKNITDPGLISWIKDTLPTIQNADRKFRILYLILLNGNKYLDLMHWAKATIPTIQTEKNKTTIIDLLFFSTSLIDPNLMSWIKDSLPDIQDDHNKTKIICDILGKNITDPDLISWIKDSLPGIQDNNDKSVIILNMLSKHITDPNLISWVKTTLPDIQNSSFTTDLIKLILEKFITDPDLLDWVKRTLPTIQDDYAKESIIKLILEKFITNPDLLSWVKRTLPAIQDDSTKERIIKFIVGKDITNPDLLSWVKRTLPTIQNDFIKESIIKFILDKNSSNQNLIKAVKNTLFTIRGSYIKPYIVEYVLNINITDPNINLEALLDVAKKIKRAFWWFLSKHDQLQDRLNQKIQEIEAEIQRRKTAETTATLGFLSKIKQFWNKLTFRKQSKTIIKTA